MKYNKIEIGSYNLHLIKIDKFKTIFFKFIFRDEVKKEDITIRNILLDLLTTSSKKYSTKQLINIKKQDLYDLELQARNSRIGNHILSEISFSILDEEYINNSILEDTIDFMKEIIFNPNVNNNKFDETMFNIAKSLIKSDVLSIKDYPNLYANMRLKENMDNRNPFSFNMNGYLEDLEKINSEDVYKYYDKFINNSLIDIFVVGNIDMYEVEKLMRERICFKTIKKIKKDIVNSYIPMRKNPKKIEESGDYKQTRLEIGCSLKDLDEIEKKYTLFIYNIIFGNSPDSKLFTNIRENKSLTYTIKSKYMKNDNLLFITTGIDKEKGELVIKNIKKEMNSMVKGNFTEDEINNAKEIIISSLNEFEEYKNSISDYYFGLQYLENDKIEKSIKMIRSITKEDIIKLSKKIKIDTIYILKEKENEKD